MLQLINQFWCQFVEVMKNVLRTKMNQLCNSWDFQGNEKNVISIALGV